MQENQVVIGVDPGVTGCGVVFGASGMIDFCDWSEAAEAADFVGFWASQGLAALAVEDARQKGLDSPRSAVTFQRNIGFWWGLGAAHGVPVIWVWPRSWQAHCALRKREGRNDKPGLDKARELWPDLASGFLKRKMDHNRADALLIAKWAYEKGAKEHGKRV